MRISGLQKVSVIDYPGEIACTIFLHGCNFRCGFCYNPDLVTKEFDTGFSEDYVLDFLKNRVGKLDAVCITGGEPLMTLDFDFVRKIKDLGFKVKLDTNGSFPNRLREMIDLGLVDYVAMDIKGDREDYSKVVGVDVGLEKIEESIKMIHDFGNGTIDTRMNTDEHGFKGKVNGNGACEFRTTVVGRLHSKESIVEMAKWLNGVCGAKPKRFFLQGFKANKDGMIDSSFMDELDVNEGFLDELKGCVGEWFEKVEVRV